MNKQVIIAHITPEVYSIECEDAWRAAPFTGGFDLTYAYASDTPFAISQLIWETESSLEACQQVDLLFEVYLDLPCYTLLSQVKIHYYHQLPEDARERYWSHISVLLSQPEEALAQPLIYSLAVDFFEDPDLCQHVWERLVVPQAPDLLIQRVLEASAAVPFKLKHQLYQRLLPALAWHMPIYTSLRASYYSVYGDIDKVLAGAMLQQLAITESQEWHEFQRALRVGERYANYYLDRKAMP